MHPLLHFLQANAIGWHSNGRWLCFIVRGVSLKNPTVSKRNGWKRAKIRKEFKRRENFAWKSCRSRRRRRSRRPFRTCGTAGGSRTIMRTCAWLATPPRRWCPQSQSRLRRGARAGPRVRSDRVTRYATCMSASVHQYPPRVKDAVHCPTSASSSIFSICFAAARPPDVWSYRRSHSQRSLTHTSRASTATIAVTRRIGDRAASPSAKLRPPQCGASAKPSGRCLM